MPNEIDNFIKQLVLKAFITNKFDWTLDDLKIS